MSDQREYRHWRPHPWHGLTVGPQPPQVVHAYIEITPFDLIKYEIDKVAGILRVDRPQRTSSLPPALYGFIPRTYCADQVGHLCEQADRGDDDPLDICVISERPINRSEVILNARVIGGIQVIDHHEADDKIISVLDNDNIWGKVEDYTDLPEILIERLRHYFATYKMVPGQPSRLTVERIYDCQHAHRVVEAAMQDYDAAFVDC